MRAPCLNVRRNDEEYPFRCQYCFEQDWNKAFEGKGKLLQRYSVERFVDELEEVGAQWDTRFWKFYDDVFPIIYTNANKKHVDSILNQLDIENIFEGIFDIANANYIPKPEMAPYKKLIDKFNIDPKKTVMFDDIARNLVPASKLGFTTVWIDIGKENYSDDIKNSKKYLNYETTSLPLWLNSIIKES